MKLLDLVKVVETLANNPTAGEIAGVMIFSAGLAGIVTGSSLWIISYKAKRL